MRHQHDRRPDTWGDPARQRYHCAECGAVTAGGKPYCPEHVAAMPYVRWLWAAHQAAGAELAAVEARVRAGLDAFHLVDLTGLVALEVLTRCEQRPSTARAVARHVDLFGTVEDRIKVAEVYTEALYRAGLLAARSFARTGPIYEVSA